jgi:hypothetical protein
VTRNLALSITLIANLFARLLFAATIHVPADQPTIQAGINAASNGDTVLVAPGTYYENLTFNGKAITVKSSNGANVTTIDGSVIDIVVKFVTSEGLSSVLDGFTIKNGNGLGIYVLSSSPTIKNNIITSNSGCPGAGINVGDGSPLIKNNTITNNAQTTCFGGTDAGGISVGGPPAGAQIIGNRISGNNATLGTGGGGISLFAVGSVLIENNYISNNAGYDGGGIGALSFTSSVQIIQNVITGNSAAEGGGIEIDNSVALVLNNSVFANDAPTGSALYAHFYTTTGPMTMSNNLFIGKQGEPAVDCRGYDTVSPPVFSFNDVFTQGGPNYGSGCIDQTGMNSNISASPVFVGAKNPRLKGGSPAIDAGDNSAPDLPAKDFSGNPRIINGNGGATAIVDMGAYEFVPVVVAPKSLAFGLQAVGSTTSKTVKLTNSQNKILNISSYSVPTGYSVSGCGSSVAAFTSCTLTVTFHPLTTGTFKGSLIVTDDAGNSPQTASLSGSAQ